MINLKMTMFSMVCHVVKIPGYLFLNECVSCVYV